MMDGGPRRMTWGAASASASDYRDGRLRVTAGRCGGGGGLSLRRVRRAVESDGRRVAAASDAGGASEGRPRRVTRAAAREPH